ncbi:MAG: hypothetical protein MUC94_18005 [bacterium]|jgi:hypothetical protein|nr:hypothetical protein [bacterium]
MVTVRLTKKVGRLPQGTIGTISNSDHANYGVGKDFEHGIQFPHKIAFYVDGQEWSIQNNLLEAVPLPAAKQPERQKPKMQLVLI